MLSKSALVAFAGAAVAEGAYKIDHDESVFVDASGRQRWWHGVNMVMKKKPYYPVIADHHIDVIKKIGNVVRLGVMMPGMYPEGPALNTKYLDKIEELVDLLHSHGIETILDLHQDVLAPKICGEGTPNWMLNTTDLHSMPLPRPAAYHKIDIKPNGVPKSCHPVGTAKVIGWSEWYLTDMAGKAFKSLYDGHSVMSRAFAAYWAAVAKRFKGHPGVMAYELLNEPWVGDHVGSPSLLMRAGKAEKEVAKYMQKMHDVIKKIDPDTMMLYAPAEANNRFMRRVGYEHGFLPEAGMAYHVYCTIGTDASGPTNALSKKFCHYNDNHMMDQRQSDLRRLRTAGFVTEFGAVNPDKTGLAEVKFVADHLDAMQPPSSWTFWDYHELSCRNATSNQIYQDKLARPFPKAIAGKLHSTKFDDETNVYTVKYAAVKGISEIFLPIAVRYPHGFNVKVTPPGAVTVKNTEFGLSLSSESKSEVSIDVTPKHEAIIV